MWKYNKQHHLDYGSTCESMVKYFYIHKKHTNKHNMYDLSDKSTKRQLIVFCKTHSKFED